MAHLIFIIVFIPLSAFGLIVSVFALIENVCSFNDWVSALGMAFALVSLIISSVKLFEKKNKDE